MAGGEITEMDRNRIMEELMGHTKVPGFYSMCDRKPWKYTDLHINGSLCGSYDDGAERPQ